MIVPRHRLDISLGDLVFAVFAALLARQPDRRARSIVTRWAGSDEGLACLSVRSAFDCLLSALELPAGDEILVSAITHPDMVKIAVDHGLIPVPVDLDVGTMAPRLDALERASTPRTRALLVAHLFGARFDVASVAEFARRRGYLLIEDCAQTIFGPDDSGDPLADVSLYSFGSIKTATALGGALVRVRNPGLLERMVQIEASWPRQARREHALKSLKYMALVMLDRPLTYTALVRLTRAIHVDVDHFVTQTVRAFRAPPGEDTQAAFTRWLRRRPATPLLALLARRLRRFDGRRLDARRHAGRFMDAALAPVLGRPGDALDDSTHWVYPVRSADPAALVLALRVAGFDATRVTSAIAVVEPPADRIELDPEVARSVMAEIVFLPVYPELGQTALERLASASVRAELRSEDHRTRGLVVA